MIIGDYPCCDKELLIPIPDGVKLPAFSKEQCPYCGATVWHYISRVAPESYTDEQFLKEWTVDENTKQIKRKKDVVNAKTLR